MTIHILPTENTPEVHLNQEGSIRIKGRAVTIYKAELLGQILNWVKVYLNNPAEITTVEIAFEYLNSYGTTIFTAILKELAKVTLQSKKLVIYWYYEEDDEDILEHGEAISSVINIPFKFIVVKRVSDL